MTFREYENLQVGDKVILAFSTDKEHIVINANSDMIETKPIGSAHNSIIYKNHYKDIKLDKKSNDKTEELELVGQKEATKYLHKEIIKLILEEYIN